LIGGLRDGVIEPSPAVVDLCLESVDVLKKTLHRQWADEVAMRTGVDSLLGRIAEFAPLDPEEAEASAASPGQRNFGIRAKQKRRQKSLHRRKSLRSNLLAALRRLSRFELRWPGSTA